MSGAERKRKAAPLYLVGLDLPGYAFVGLAGSACNRSNAVTTIGALDRGGARRVLARFPHMTAFRLTPVRLKATETGARGG